MGSHVIVHTDHAAIRYLMSKKDGKTRLIHWVFLLQELNLEVVDKKGKYKAIADHISRLESEEKEDTTRDIHENFSG